MEDVDVCIFEIFFVEELGVGIFGYVVGGVDCE